MKLLKLAFLIIPVALLAAQYNTNNATLGPWPQYVTDAAGNHLATAGMDSNTAASYGLLNVATSNQTVMVTNAIPVMLQLEIATITAAASNVFGAGWMTNADFGLLVSGKLGTMSVPNSNNLWRVTLVEAYQADIFAACGRNPTNWYPAGATATTNPVTLTYPVLQ